MKNLFVITKTIWQIILYVIEVFGISILFAYLSTYIKDICDNFELIERIILCFTIYQILILVILTNLNDIHKDSYLAYKTLLKKCILYVDFKDNNIKHDILSTVKYQLDNATFNSKYLQDKYILIQNNVNKLNKLYLQNVLIIAEHQYEYWALNWHYSFLLRIFKRGFCKKIKY